VAEELCHEGHAEAADFVIGFTLWVEIGAALSAANVQASQTIFECLFEAEEFQDGEVDGGV
jgi:hypothetical protein